MLMVRIKMTESKVKQCCPSCSKKSQIDYDCPICGGSGTRKKTIKRYEVVKGYTDICRIDRNPETGRLRYWTSSSEYYFEEVFPTDNRYVPDIPNGIHFLHHSSEDAQRECNRINKILEERGL